MPDSAGLLEVWTYYSAKAIKHLEGPENTPKYALRDEKIKNKMGKGHRPLQMGRGHHHTPTPYMLGACCASILAPSAQDLPQTGSADDRTSH